MTIIASIIIAASIYCAIKLFFDTKESFKTKEVPETKETPEVVVVPTPVVLKTTRIVNVRVPKKTNVAPQDCVLMDDFELETVPRDESDYIPSPPNRTYNPLPTVDIEYYEKNLRTKTARLVARKVYRTTGGLDAADFRKAHIAVNNGAGINRVSKDTTFDQFVNRQDFAETSNAREWFN